MTALSIFDLAMCSPDSRCTRDPDEMAARVLRYSGRDITPSECSRLMDEWWAAIHAAPSVTIEARL